MQILYNGQWGSVCDDYWGFSDAQVVCRMLGFHEAIRAWSRYVLKYHMRRSLGLAKVQYFGTNIWRLVSSDIRI